MALITAKATGFLVAHDDEHEFHEWLHYQRSAEQIRREREGNRDRKQRQRAGHAVTPPVTASVTTAGTDAVTHGGSHRPPSPPLPEEFTSSEVSRFQTGTVSRAREGHAVTPTVTQNGDTPPDFAEVCEIVRRESDNAATWLRASTPHQAQLRREIAAWGYPAEVWQAFGKAIATREGREKLWPWARQRVAAGVDLRFLVGTPILDADGKALGGDWGPLTEALARVTRPEAFEGTDGPVSGQQRPYLIDTVECPPEVYASWLPLTPAERNAWQNRFHRVYVAGIPPRNLGWNRYTLAQIEAFEEQLRQREAVEAERGNRPALKVAVG